MKRGFYRVRIQRFLYKQFRTGTSGFVITGILEASAKTEHKQFDGYPITTNIVFGDKEAMLARESNLYAALGVKDEPSVLFEEGDIEQGVKVTKIGGKNPLGLFVNFDIKPGQFEGSPRPEVDGVYKLKEGAAGKPTFVPTDEDDEDDILEDDGETDVADADEEYEAREAELNALGIPALKNILKSDYDLPVGGKKDELVERILDHEFGAVALADDEEAEEEEEEELEEEEEVEEEEEEDDEDDGSSERREELSNFDRLELKKALKAAAPDFTVLKRHTDDELRDAIVEAEFGEETPF
jgi:hypothetical protein